ncbi:non-specific lipid transfer protein GPI-anchored 7-like isoform X2 [Rhododendron vialii]|uniref:non-specific lipid transfer protein GPI-anchored 7-like isoform X2 n=1 Tax=Rhododendron vialii TaxID=182163 RepID=UPI0026602B61|nr:non-specific lipid transfer protein GPI-anchored 7-like isoform X2 [Rhododendron vialii]
MGPPRFPAVLILAAVAVMAVGPGLADAQTLPCASALAPCVTYINLTGTPPQSCCGPMAEAVQNQMPCLCTLYTTPGLLVSVGINVGQAVLIPSRCNIVASPCGIAPAPALTPTPTSTPAPTSTPTSYQPSPATPGNGKSGVARIAWAGLPSLLLLWVSMALY